MTELDGGCKTVSFTHSFYTQYFTMLLTALYCKTFIVAVILSKRLLVKMQWYLMRGAANLDHHQQIQWHMEGAGLSSFAFLFSFDCTMTLLATNVLVTWASYAGQAPQ